MDKEKNEIAKWNDESNFVHSVFHQVPTVRHIWAKENDLRFH